MVIQRWQSLLLLVATILMVVLNFLPVARIPGVDGSMSPYFATDAPILLVLDALVAILLFISIFLFKNLRVQMRVTLLSIVLICVLGATGVFVLYRQDALATIEWTGAVLLLLCALVFAVGALRLMRRDHNLLRSADRLR